ncbi:DUF541 domain-containing protein [Flagellimonas taeanensis]|uniref:SIMPL domain-containing protein n=1 Tax=Flavobacteriaceae TaxID=49546 RepID=UPI000E687DB4|nr:MULTISPECIES: SIMPL domain-containing protein [Allomuricauda]MDC6385539.1 SIMPL domain-containing protein [Muricauda sp. SK9]RIV52414.1 DUF541 domain-containing protein [Allomuricauda taeanensis]
MKPITYILLAFLPLMGTAQEENTTIKVSAKAVHIDPSPIYKATVSLSTAFTSYLPDGIDLKQLKSDYKKAVESHGIAWDEIKETPHEFGFETMGYDKEGAVYEFTTTSVEKMRDFLGIRSLGVQRLNAVAILEIDPNEARSLSEMALKDATAKANAIALALGKELGPVEAVEDNQFMGKQIETSIYYDRPVGEYIYTLQVVFATK